MFSGTLLILGAFALVIICVVIIGVVYVFMRRDV